VAFIRREAHTLKGMGAPSGFATVTTIAHRLENYLEKAGDLSAKALADVQRYFDALSDIIARRQELDALAAAALLRALPMPGSVAEGSAGGARKRHAEALLVVSSRAVARWLERALLRHGVHAVATQSTVEGFALAVRSHPDLVVASATLAEASGIDLVRALAAMSGTRRIPTAILTSRTADEMRAVGDLPAHVPLIRLGDRLGDDVAMVLGSAGLA
jgi:chemotaxis protein histidine kinase CheA